MTINVYICVFIYFFFANNSNIWDKFFQRSKFIKGLRANILWNLWLVFMLSVNSELFVCAYTPEFETSSHPRNVSGKNKILQKQELVKPKIFGFAVVQVPTPQLRQHQQEQQQTQQQKTAEATRHPQKQRQQQQATTATADGSNWQNNSNSNNNNNNNSRFFRW